MEFVLIIISLVAIIFFTRYLTTSRQLKKVNQQLRDYNTGTSKHMIEISLGNRQIETLAKEINELIDQKNQGEIQKKRKELELKRAISGMSHDLRTPLTSIIGYLQLMEDKELDAEKSSEYISISRKKAESLQALIQNFFSLSTADSEDIPLIPEKVNITKIVKEVLLSHFDMFSTNDIEPAVMIPNDAIFIHVDENACKRVVENLILNAAQHAAGSIKLSLQKDRNIVGFTVENDWKLGEKPDTNRLFDRFYTTDESRGYSHGLGLAIVKSLMDKMDGSIQARVEGNTFKIVCSWESIN